MRSELSWSDSVPCQYIRDTIHELKDMDRALRALRRCAEGTLSERDAPKRLSIRSLVATDYSPRNRDLVNDIVSSRTSNFLSTDFLF